MGLRGFFKKGDTSEVSDEHFVEVGHDHSANMQAVPIKIAKINDYADVEKVQKFVREGSIVFVKIKGLKDKDMSELKRAIERLRKTVTALNGDIAGVDENYVICTPSFARVDRSETQAL